MNNISSLLMAAVMALDFDSVQFYVLVVDWLVALSFGHLPPGCSY